MEWKARAGEMWVQSLLICKAHGSEPTIATFGEREAVVRTLQWPCLVMQRFVDAESFVTATFRAWPAYPTGKARSSFGANRGWAAAAQHSA